MRASIWLLTSTLAFVCLSMPIAAKEFYTLADIGQGDFGLKPDQELVYKTVTLDGKTVQLKIHVFYPKGHQISEQRPAAVFYHGGGWYGGTPDQPAQQCVGFAGNE